MKDPLNSIQFRPTRAHIDLEALRHNLRLARELAGGQLSLLGVVKANAYGHGAVPISQVLEEEGIQALGVATPREAAELRQAGIRVPIFLMAGPLGAPGDFLVEKELIPVLYNLEQVAALEKSLSSPLAVHLKVDTGMHRLGILPDQLSAMIKAIHQVPFLRLTGILTHLAKADETFEGATQDQYRLFQEVEERAKKMAPEAEFFHIANSAALLGKKLGPCNWARPGLMLYGSNPHPRLKAGERLRPVMHFETQIISLKTIPAGAAVSYGGDWLAPRPSRIAVLPVGYGDGYLRHLSNVGEVFIRGSRVPVVGRVCMDLTIVDVTDLKEVQWGDPVTLWGPDLKAEDLAQKAGTISYELFCAVSGRVPRLYRGK